MLAAAGGAAILGQWPEGAFLLFLFSLGHAGEHYALDRARDAVNALGELMPATAMVRRNGDIVEEPVEQLQIGDVVVVRPGDRAPVDGVVLSGQSAIDQSPITGESAPVNKAEGDEVFAGTTNQTSALEVEVTRLAKDNTLSRVMQMVAEAQSQQSPTQRFTDRFTTWFVPAILIFVLVVIVIPPLVGWMPLEQSFYRGMLLLIAASPCALAIGTPAAVLAGIAQAARNGVLIKGGVHLENLGGIKVMAFDKTGTLTQGKFQVTDVIPLNGIGPDALLSLAAAVEQQSNHPLALAVVDAAQEKQLSLPQADGLENMAGRGVRSQVDGQPVLIGSLKLFQETDGHGLDDGLAQTVARLEGEGKTTMVVSQDGRFLGVLALADAPRPGVSETMKRLRDLGMEKLIMLTGDNEQVARRIGSEGGVTDVEAELMPEDKLEIIKRLQGEYGSVAMTGDGVNDAPALATATVGVAMGGAGTAVALETADVALMADDLSKLPFAVGLSRASRRIIKQNLAVSLGVIAILIVTSLAGVMELPGAVVFHEGSTIVVVLNALRLLRYKI
jgi:Cd2+/Zn2+-exporting ATPase